ncbi:rasGAP-activating-like protein 1 isoform X2 [Bolinopsis microptera]|uniref:rasGAP-activating-like protein 1 isoform X2 n=1 Tax=Bolinopsis microptera TaxID=2820187 RepID=UPI003079D334
MKTNDRLMEAVASSMNDSDDEFESDNTKTTIFLKIAEGKNFPIMDTLSKSSDPYCVVKVDGQTVLRTMTIYRTLSPFWGEEYTLHVQRNFFALSVYVYDEDLRYDDVIGKVTLTKKEMVRDYNIGDERWFALQKVTKDSEVTGEVRLEFKLSETKLDVKIAEARDLAAKDKTGSSDPYGILTLGSNSYQTEIRKQTRFPRWNAMTTLPVPADTADQIVRLTLWDRDIVGKDEFMGEITFSLKRIEKKLEYNQWFWLKPRDFIGHQAAGSIRMKIRYVTASILPSLVYQPLIDLLIEEVDNFTNGIPRTGITPLALLEEAMTDRMEMAYMLVRIFLGKGKIEGLLSMLFTLEAKKSTPETIFRENTLASKCMDQYMKITGTLYLQNVLGKTIKLIYKENKYCEMDKSRITKKYGILNKEAIVKQSTKQINLYLMEIVNSIMQSKTASPFGIRKVCAMIFDLVHRTFPENPDLQYMAVSSFVFLRFFVPAIMNPKLFYLNSNHPNMRISRTLMLCAKAMQQIGNMCAQPCKESFMLPLLPFVERQTDNVRHFISNLVTIYKCSSPPAKIATPTSQHLFSHTTIIQSGWAEKYRISLGQSQTVRVFKKRFFSLSFAALSYGSKASSGQSLGCTKLIAISDITSVERVDKYVFGHKHILQILISKNNERPSVLYMKLKTLNEVTEWISSLRKTCSKNTKTLKFYHPGAYKCKRWSCCTARSLIDQGCSKTHRSIVLGDWRDPLNSDAEIQTIFSQLYNAKDCLRTKYLKAERLRQSFSFLSTADMGDVENLGGQEPFKTRHFKSVVNRRAVLKKSKKTNLNRSRAQSMSLHSPEHLSPKSLSMEIKETQNISLYLPERAYLWTPLHLLSLNFKGLTCLVWFKALLYHLF